jgi:peptidoglycan/LPS O-acetylase OafA/YrhL
MEPIPRATENSINAVRLLAALQVVYVHATAHLHLEPVIGHNYIVQFPGVPIFFAVSGFLVFDSLLRLSSNRDFYRHRLLRIYPALLVNIVILEFVFAMGGGMHIDVVGPAKTFFFEIVYLITASDELAFRYAGARGLRSFDGFFQMYPSGVLWTLTVELTFYLMIPLFRFAGDRKIAATALILILGIASIGSNSFIEKSLLFSLSALPYFWIFGIGMLLRLWPPVSWRFTFPVFLAGSLACASAAGFPDPAWKIDATWLAMLQIALLSCAAIILGLSRKFFFKVLARNDVSYGVYLYHMLIVTVATRLAVGQIYKLPAVVFLSILFGFLSWRFIEKPAMAWRNDASK